MKENNHDENSRDMVSEEVSPQMQPLKEESLVRVDNQPLLLLCFQPQEKQLEKQQCMPDGIRGEGSKS